MLWLTAIFAVFVVAPALLAQEDPGHPISIDLRDCELSAAIRTLMQASGANIVLAGEVTGNVTCTIKDKPLEEILDLLAAANQFYWHKKNGVYVISRRPLNDVVPATNEVTPPPPPPATSGTIDLRPRTVAQEPELRQKAKVELIRLRHMDARSAVELIVNGRDPALERVAAAMRESGFSTTGMFRNPSLGGLGSSIAGGGFYDQMAGAAAPRTNVFPGSAVGAGTSVDALAQMPGGGGMMGGGMMGGGGIPGGGGMMGGRMVGGAGGMGGMGGIALLPEGIQGLMPYDLTNSLLVRGTPEAIAELRDIIKMLDVPPRQVRIEAEFLTVNVGDEDQFGFNWQITDGQTEISADASSGGDLNVRYARGNFAAAIQALKKNNRGRTIIAPRVTTMNQRPAMLSSTQDYYYTTTQTIMGNFGNIAQSKQTQTIQVGIGLMVLPRINGDDSVTMYLQPVIQDVIGTYDAPEQGQMPITQTQQINLPEIRVPNGQTLVLGGLVRRLDSHTSRRLPFFSDLPLIGNLFRSRQQQLSDSELLIFLTPTVLPDDSAPEALLPSSSTPAAPSPQPVGP